MGLFPKIVIAIVIVGAGVYAFMHYNSRDTAPLQPVTQVAPVTQAPTPQASSLEVTGSNDAALSADLLSVDAQVSEMDTHSTAASNFSDSPIEQTE